MNDITRRRFIEAASLAAAAPPFAAAQSTTQTPATAPAAPTRGAAPRGTSRARDLTDAELEAMFRRCSNTGKWGPNDELGTLNYITPAKRVAAAGLVKTGEVVSAGRDLVTRQSKTNAQPVVHMMMFSDANSPSCGDYFTIASHGMVVTHMDALCHFSWKDQLYNGRKRSETLTASGARWGSIYVQRQGIFTRGVLLDVAAARGINWYQPNEYVTVADFAAAEKRQGVRVESGDAIFVRTGMERMEAELGEQDIYPACRHARRMRGMDAQPPGVGVRRRLHREAAVPERELHLGGPHDRARLDGAAHSRLALADRVGRDLRASQALGLPSDDRPAPAAGRHRVACQSVVSLLGSAAGYLPASSALRAADSAFRRL